MLRSTIRKIIGLLVPECWEEKSLFQINHVLTWVEKNGGRYLGTMGKLQSPDKEKHVFHFESIIPEEISTHKRHCLLGLVVCEKLVNMKHFCSMMQNIWRLQKIVVFNEVGNNLFMVEFQEIVYLKKV